MSRRPGAMLALLAFAQLIISLDYTIVYVALPDIGRELGFSAQSLQWVVSAYAVAFGGFLLLGGRACDLFGPRRVFAIGCALYAGSSPELGWASAVVLGAASAGAALLAAFAVIERRGRDPLLPPRLLRERNLGTGVVVTFLYMGTFGTLLYFLTGYFQGVHGYGALATGLAFGVPMVAIAAGSQAAGRLATRYGTRPTLVVSLVVGGAGAALLGLSMTADASYAALIPALVVLGLGQGAGYTLMFGAAAAGIPPSAQGIASGVASTAQQVGGTVGLAVFVAVANADTPGLSGEALQVATMDGLRTAVLLAAAGIALTALAALRFSAPRQLVAVPA